MQAVQCDEVIRFDVVLGEAGDFLYYPVLADFNPHVASGWSEVNTQHMLVYCFYTDYLYVRAYPTYFSQCLRHAVPHSSVCLYCHS